MFIDLHCHLLFGLDDGARDRGETVAMARVLVGLGFSTVAASPHAGPEGASREAVEARRAEVEALLAASEVPLRVVSNAENRLDGEFLERELAGEGRHIAGSRYVLVEAPYETPVPSLPEITFRLRRKGVRPLFAHPERCAEFQPPGRAEEAVRTGGLLQLDLGSLAGRYGRACRKTALRLLEAGLYAVAATDLHEAEGSEKWLREALRELERRAGAGGVRRLLAENPARLVRDEEME